MESTEHRDAEEDRFRAASIKSPLHLYVGGKGKVGPHAPKIGKDKGKGPAVEALKDTRRQQVAPKTAIPTAVFKRLVEEVQTTVANGLVEGDAQPIYEMEPEAVEALQVGTEDYLVRVFKEANLVAIRANRVTIKPGDVRKAVERVRGDGVHTPVTFGRRNAPPTPSLPRKGPTAQQHIDPMAINTKDVAGPSGCGVWRIDDDAETLPVHNSPVSGYSSSSRSGSRSPQYVGK